MMFICNYNCIYQIEKVKGHQVQQDVDILPASLYSHVIYLLSQLNTNKTESDYLNLTDPSSSGHREEFMLPDRNRFVSMDLHFLKCYMVLLIQTCHRRNALATGGMSALLLPSGDNKCDKQLVIKKVCE